MRRKLLLPAILLFAFTSVMPAQSSPAGTPDVPAATGDARDQNPPETQQEPNSTPNQGIPAQAAPKQPRHKRHWSTFDTVLAVSTGLLFILLFKFDG